MRGEGDGGQTARILKGGVTDHQGSLIVTALLEGNGIDLAIARKSAVRDRRNGILHGLRIVVYDDGALVFCGNGHEVMALGADMLRLSGDDPGRQITAEIILQAVILVHQTDLVFEEAIVIGDECVVEFHSAVAEVESQILGQNAVKGIERDVGELHITAEIHTL